MPCASSALGYFTAAREKRLLQVFVCYVFDEIITPVIYRDIIIYFKHYFSGIFHFGSVSYRVSNNCDCDVTLI